MDFFGDNFASPETISMYLYVKLILELKLKLVLPWEKMFRTYKVGTLWKNTISTQEILYLRLWSQSKGLINVY